MSIFSSLELSSLKAKGLEFFNSQKTLAEAIDEVKILQEVDFDKVDLDGIVFDRVQSCVINFPNNVTTSPVASGSIVTEHLNQGLITIDIRGTCYKFISKISQLNRYATITSNRLGSLNLFEDQYTAQAQSIVNDVSLKANETINFVDSRLSGVRGFYNDLQKFLGDNKSQNQHLQTIIKAQGMKSHLFSNITVKGLNFKEQKKYFVITNLSVEFDDILNDAVNINISLQEYRTVEVVSAERTITTKQVDKNISKSVKQASEKTVQGKRTEPSILFKGSKKAGIL